MQHERTCDNQSAKSSHETIASLVAPKTFGIEGGPLDLLTPTVPRSARGRPPIGPIGLSMEAIGCSASSRCTGPLLKHSNLRFPAEAEVQRDKTRPPDYLRLGQLEDLFDSRR